jgi:hypothetical protein
VIPKAGITREFWVIDANERVTWVHTNPRKDGWGSVVERRPDETLTTSAIPGSLFDWTQSADGLGYSAAARACPSRRLSAPISSSAASAITVPGGKIAAAPADRRAS